MIQIEESNPSFESCHDCIHDDDSEEICILRRCIHAVVQLEECYVPKQHKKGTWIEQDDSWDGVYYECSACGEPWTTIDGTPWDNGMNFCPKCGAEMTEESEEPKRCDTCKHEKEPWTSGCSDCFDYELWEEKDETGRSTTEN